jgi:hypothetical protein
MVGCDNNWTEIIEIECLRRQQTYLPLKKLIDAIFNTKQLTVRKRHDHYK